MFIIEGKNKLNGTVRVSGSKNAALPILCAALLSKEKVIVKNVPNISDVRAILEIFESIGVKTTMENNIVNIDASGLNNGKISDSLVNKMRASILLLGGVLPRCGELNISFPGGCVLGKRSVFAHTFAFEKLGVKILESENRLHLKMDKLQAAAILMPEMSVTATENAIMMAVLAPGVTHLKLAAAEPHVQDLCRFLNSMGAKISGIGTHYLKIEGISKLHGTEYSVIGDYLEAGTLSIAGIICGGEIKIEGIPTWQLDSFWQKFDEIGVNYSVTEDTILIKPSAKLIAPTTLRTAVYPSFATDLQAPFSVLLTQVEGNTRIFETLFEGRLNYLVELEKMGAKIEILNPHQAIIKGHSRLKGVPIASIDIRAGAAMVLAGLIAEGTTEISNIKYIDRGYENFDKKLTSLGAKITRINMSLV